MLEKISHYYNKYYTELTWFIVGLLFNNMMVHLSLGQWGMALVDIVIAGLNIYFWKARRDV